MPKECFCFHCNYTWERRVALPKSCPRCKQRLDVKPKRRK